jgi:hypothetical protein
MARETEERQVRVAYHLQLMCLGHFLNAIQMLGINVDNVLISKPMHWAKY